MNMDMLPLNSAATTYAKDWNTDAIPSKVLICVKATPQPSKKYGDTVCVAGIDITTDEFRWVRLYPIAHRHIDSDAQFKKFDVVEVPLTPRRGDPRAESFVPRLDQLKRVAHLGKWQQRHEYISPFVDEWTMCGILEALKETRQYPSLAVIRPRDFSGIDVEPHPGWSPETIQSMRNHADQGDLFTGHAQSNQILEAPRFRGWYKFRCEDSSCPGHRQGILDWEFTALQRRLTDRSDSEARSLVGRRFLTELTDQSRGPLLFVGNTLRYPRSFSVLGIYRSRS